MNIRSATSDDVPTMVRLSEQWAAEGITRGQQPDPAEHFRDSSYLLVADSDGVIVGFAQGEREVSGPEHTAVLPVGTPYLDITNLFVIPECRSQQVGSRLVDELLARATADGVERAMVYSAATELDRVMAFYQSHGFHGWFVQLFR